MNTSALIFMITTQVLITGVTIYLYIKVLSKPSKK